jgi:hypothetical protein
MTVTGVSLWGLIGAAGAVPVYFTVQLASAIFFSRSRRNGLTRPQFEGTA